MTYFKSNVIDVSNYLRSRWIEGYTTSKQFSNGEFLFINIFFRHNEGMSLTRRERREEGQCMVDWIFVKLIHFKAMFFDNTKRSSRA